MLTTLAHRRRPSTTSAESIASASASSTAQSRRTSFACATKLPTASTRLSPRPRSSSCASI
eukprot:668340-Pleurochrysis_carterae.AAC.1